MNRNTKRMLAALLTTLLIFQTALGQTLTTPTTQSTSLTSTTAPPKIGHQLKKKIDETTGTWSATERCRVIVRVNPYAVQSAANMAVANAIGTVKRSHSSLGLMSVELPLSQVQALAADSSI